MNEFESIIYSDIYAPVYIDDGMTIFYEVIENILTKPCLSEIGECTDNYM